MNNSTIFPLLILLAALVGVGLLNYWLGICRVLYKNGAKFPTGLAFWRAPRELRVYRELRATRAQSLAPYYVMHILVWFNVFLLVAVILLALWSRSQPV